MSEGLLSVGVDLGTSTTQMVVSRLTVKNTAAPFTVPRMEITGREILYESPVRFTPLLSADTLDAAAIGRLLRQEYASAGITPEAVQTGAVIITGETARKENARQVLQEISDLAGDFVVATAGPALESVLAARGAGADRLAAERGRPVIHMDIGGGTTNFAVFDSRGNLTDTGCLNAGGRLVKLSPDGEVTYISPVVDGMENLTLGQTADKTALTRLADTMVRMLEQAVGLQPAGKELEHWITDKLPALPGEAPVLSFSGGVAKLMEHPPEDLLAYGDMGVLLAERILGSALCRGDYVTGRETIRATVVGAGSYATELSGSTVTYGGAEFPIHDLPAMCLTPEEEQLPSAELARVIGEKRRLHTGNAALTMTGIVRSYDDILRLSEGILRGMAGLSPLVVVLEHDAAKALGQAMETAVPGLVCLDGLHVPRGSYLDIGAPTGGGAALPVVVKTLAF